MSYFGKRTKPKVLAEPKNFVFRASELKILLEASLSRLEKDIFINLASLEGMTFSCAVKQLPYSESSAKTVIRRLKAKQLIECGNKNNTNVPLVLTDFGRKIFSVLDNRWLQKLL